MSDIKPQIDRKQVFLGILYLLGGVISILVPASALHDRSLIGFTLLGIPLVMLGTSTIWDVIREKQRDKHKTKDTKGQDTFK
jgi:uncharacterized membrane protein HdeD (DUF308 family)